ncbi:chaplin [Streptomyces sp. ISL-100]|uniref:chaplin n=1 Tax=Streptomyces sp. ISL-100 TaxID=2819173 RepID=UPI001BE76911|nr:chaplin family protein [Streptomyces sp. ISL-100]MBT2400280.1 DUF320 domain-containing protein [Streptomyces sp. ISL-100]
MFAAAAASGLLAMTTGSALADSGADGDVSHSPGAASGNNIQVPVHIPVNACGNTINIIALLNPAFGNECANIDHKTKPSKPGHGNPGPGKPPGKDRPGHGNPPGGGHPGEDHPGKKPPRSEPPRHEPPRAEPPRHEPPRSERPRHEPSVNKPPMKESSAVAPSERVRPAADAAPSLAETGAGELGVAAAMSAALLGGGVLMFRRNKAPQA